MASFEDLGPEAYDSKEVQAFVDRHIMYLLDYVADGELFAPARRYQPNVDNDNDDGKSDAQQQKLQQIVTVIWKTLIEEISLTPKDDSGDTTSDKLSRDQAATEELPDEDPISANKPLRLASLRSQVPVKPHLQKAIAQGHMNYDWLGVHVLALWRNVLRSRRCKRLRMAKKRQAELKQLGEDAKKRLEVIMASQGLSDHDSLVENDDPAQGGAPAQENIATGNDSPIA
ncbi:hypothetical protein N7468_005413 [Penicillium chermesinum]|uniref:Uncharacterized protein n=1 Tax=Penicillium chermesinum TaxID=63820 RepID=A0A9W9NZ94_9EURO|nr:uncharacterized protein N7468_005413 [Penicillium chermesinum]KAJ5232457.1 hypothetical protein N7468_005413 [Penicillium chermesinum]KAJ6172115.1 hypothetical protein N7470_001182 [Penicillium chermesinum]